VTGVSALVAEVALSGLEQILVAIALAALGGIGLISRTKYNRWTSSKKRVERENLSKIEATQTFLLGTLKLLVNAGSGRPSAGTTANPSGHDARLVTADTYAEWLRLCTVLVLNPGSVDPMDDRIAALNRNVTNDLEQQRRRARGGHDLTFADLERDDVLAAWDAYREAVQGETPVETDDDTSPSLRGS
jgi:hypothetical protein